LFVENRTGGLPVQVLQVLEAVSQVAEERVVEVLEHASLADDVSHVFLAYD